jgi:hypothetical protein
MSSTCFKWVVASSLTVASFACDHFQPVAPTWDVRASSAPGVTVNAPSSLIAIAVSTSRIDLSWQDNSTNESGFEVHRSTTGPSGASTLHASLAANTTALSDSGLTASTQYCYKVRAFQTKPTKTYFSAFSAAACVTTPAPPPPPPPPGPPSAPSAATARPYGFGEVLVTWTNNGTNQDGFRVERSADSGSTWTTLATTGPTFEDIAPDPVDQPVCYRVIAFNSYGESAPSNVACAVVLAGPSGLTMVGDDLTWADNSSVESGYELWFMDVDGGPAYDGLAGTYPANTTSLPGLGPCMVSWCWGWVVMAVSSDGGRSWYAAVQTRFP